VLALFAAALASSVTASPILESAQPWWERITVTVDDKGEQRRCLYETSSSGAATCDEAMAASIPGTAGKSGSFSKVTYERRFSPGGAQLDSGRLRPGDTLLGRQVMFLTFDAQGAIDSCKVVAATGELEFSYDCDAARKEQFRAQANADPAARQAFLTVLAYGHIERIV